MNSKVEKEFKSGGITVTVWNNEQYGANGRFESKTVSMSKRYNKNGKWEKTQSFKISELPTLIEVLRKGFSQMAIDGD